MVNFNNFTLYNISASLKDFIYHSLGAVNLIGSLVTMEEIATKIWYIYQIIVRQERLALYSKYNQNVNYIRPQVDLF